ncbi:MAG: hypothetical protein A2138_13120 [Deltaproteobacteria bacterium RBG_16_71_12]|nr:MAG: hypothetical protein A2138_13120 [Deltaproteobacteria bacterium RBG_16_71_12]
MTLAQRVQQWIGRALAAVLFGAVVYVYVKLIDSHPHAGWDGQLYLDVAQNLKSGAGLTIDCSIYNHGFRSFPHPTSLYPLWPMVLSIALRYLSTQVAATTFPAVLALVALALAYLWGKRILPARVLPLGLHGGHLALGVFGLHLDFAHFATGPNTESLAFLILFAALLRGDRLFLRMGVRDGAELGLWCGALFLTRSQMLPSMLAVLAALPLLLLLGCGKRALWFTLASIASFTASYAPMHWWMTTFLETPSFGSFVDFTYARVPSTLSDIEQVAAHPTLASRVAGIAHGLDVAAAPTTGYWAFFEGFALTLPVALLVAAAWLAWHGREGLHRLREHFVDARCHGMVWGVVTALGSFALLHVAQRESDQWWFGNRHAITAGLLFCFSGVVIARAFRWLRWPAVVALIVATGSLADRAVEQAKAVVPMPPIESYNLRLTRWLERQRDRAGGKLVVAISSQEARAMCGRVSGVGMHAMSKYNTYEDLQVMTRDLGAGFLLFRDAVPSRYLRDPRFATDLTRVGEVRVSRSHTFLVYAPPAPAPAPAMPP